MEEQKQGGSLVIMNRQELASFSTNTGGLRPSNLQEAMQLANLLADSGFVPKDFQGSPGNVLAAIQFGAEVGLAPMQALQNIAVVNGRPSIWGDAALAICMQHPLWRGIEETDDGETATCTVKRGEAMIRRTFSMAEARQAELATKSGPWKQYPKRMRQMRARGFALRDAFPDSLKGLVLGEEARDYVDTVGEPMVDPKTGEVLERKPAPTPAALIENMVTVDLPRCTTREHLVAWARELNAIDAPKAGAKKDAWTAWSTKCASLELVPKELADEARKEAQS